MILESSLVDRGRCGVVVNVDATDAQALCGGVVECDMYRRCVVDEDLR